MAQAGRLTPTVMEKVFRDTMKLKQEAAKDDVAKVEEVTGTISVTPNIPNTTGFGSINVGGTPVVDDDTVMLSPWTFGEMFRPQPVRRQPKMESPLTIAKKIVKPKLNVDSVILSDSKKEEIKAVISQTHNNDLIFQEWGFAEVFEKGTAITLLFYGVPGTGKTLMAQAIADELDADLKIYSTAEIQSSEPGGAERTVKKLFAEAREFLTGTKKKRVILFDECDSLLANRNNVGVILGSQINVLLSEIEQHDGIVIFTTNRLGKLDPALERRITAKIEFPFPSAAQRVDIWKRLIPAKAPLDKGVDFKKLAKYSLAGGNIKNAVLNAARMAAYKKAKTIEMSHFLDAIKREDESSKAFADHRQEASGGYSTSAEDFANESGHIDIKDEFINIDERIGGIE